mgnify:FL=1
MARDLAGSLVVEDTEGLGNHLAEEHKILVEERNFLADHTLPEGSSCLAGLGFHKWEPYHMLLPGC